MEMVREIVNAINYYKKMYPIIALSGPRQSGKTTLLKEFFPNYQYVSLENIDVRSFLENDPNGFFEKYSSYCIFDEAQRAPLLFSYLQTKVDNDKIMGQYILSGSQNFHLMKNITQSLAGRVAILKLFPFDFNELKQHNLLNKDYVKTMLKGFYPAIYDREIPANKFYNNYIQTYVERDITDLVNIHDMRTFRMFLSLCAARAGHLLNLSNLAKDCGISQPTAKSWLSALESSYILFLLQPLHNNFNKRVMKSPKLYFYDTGLLCHLLKIKDENQIITNSIKGNLFENMIVAEYVKQNFHQDKGDEFWFWRDSAGHEVDLIRQDDFLYNVIEIKSTATITYDLFKGMTYFKDLAKENVKSQTLIYAGLENQNRTIANVVSWYDIK
jgi:predicted AAA+ superfamily ATPase